MQRWEDFRFSTAAGPTESAQPAIPGGHDFAGRSAFAFAALVYETPGVLVSSVVLELMFPRLLAVLGQVAWASCAAIVVGREMECGLLVGIGKPAVFVTPYLPQCFIARASAVLGMNAPVFPARIAAEAVAGHATGGGAAGMGAPFTLAHTHLLVQLR